jgi:hypothetical protein
MKHILNPIIFTFKVEDLHLSQGEFWSTVLLLEAKGLKYKVQIPK